MFGGHKMSNWILVYTHLNKIQCYHCNIVLFVINRKIGCANFSNKCNSLRV